MDDFDDDFSIPFGNLLLLSDCSVFKTHRCAGCKKTESENDGKYPIYSGFCYDCAKCSRCKKTATENGGYHLHLNGFCHHCERINKEGLGG